MGNHRADRHDRKAVVPSSSRVPTPAGGRRKATPRRRTGALGIPALPTIAGSVAIVAAAGGAVASQGVSASSISLSAGTANFTGTDATFVLSDRDPRARAISRDSERQALEDAAEAKLQEAVEEQSKERNAALASLAKDAEARAAEIEKNLWSYPTDARRLTARYGQTGLWATYHTGLDFAGPTGTAIYAVANGVITSVGYDGAYGLKTVLTLEDGTEIWYCHQSSTGAEEGETVTSGEQIGEVGSTGHVTGPHLHLEVRPGGGDPVDPYTALLAHGITP